MQRQVRLDPVTSEAVTASLFDFGLLAIFHMLAFAGAFVVFLWFDMR